MQTLRDLTRYFPRTGLVTGLVVRPARGERAVAVEAATAIVGRGLEGDRRSGAGPTRSAAGHAREVTIIQAETIPLIGRWVGRDDVDAVTLRRNLVVSGLNVLAMRSPFADQILLWRIGAEVVLRVTGPCDPCSRMDAALGPGGYNALRAHGGVTATIVAGGRIRVGDAVTLDDPDRVPAPAAAQP